MKEMAENAFLTNEMILNPFLLLAAVCPNLEEVMVLGRRGPMGSTIDDLYEDPRLQNVDLQNVEGRGVVKDILARVEEAKTAGACRDLKLTFVRVEKWER